MAHSPRFARLRSLFAVALHARKEGIAEPALARQSFEASRLNRRQLLQLAGAGAAVGALPLANACKPKEEAGPVIAVIGGGIAGLHCAYRLFQAGMDVIVYEASDRVGGRMWTSRDALPDGLICELGGELIDSNHSVVRGLATELGVVLDDRQEGEVGEDLWWLDGAAVSEDTLIIQLIEAADVFQEFYDKAENSSDDLYTLDFTSLELWLSVNIPLETWPELNRILNVAYRGEFGLETAEQSCLNLIYLIDRDPGAHFTLFGASDERWHAHDGNGALIEALSGELDFAGRVEVESKLVKLVEDQGRYTLTLADPTSHTREATADHVVFAIPFSTLRDVHMDQVNISETKRLIINDLGYGTNSKVMGAFTRPVWREDHGDSGALVGELSTQQTWDSSIGQGVSGAVLTNFLGGTAGVQVGAMAAEDWMGTVLAELETVWSGVSAAYQAESAVMMAWPGYTYNKGSYACYLPGQWSFWTYEGRREGNLHFCGEHCSIDFQGWMEGAAETGGMVAAEILDDYDLARPAQLDALLGERLAIPQASYHGDRLGRLNPVTRRRGGPAW